jgi:hypothetical protein
MKTTYYTGKGEQAPKTLTIKYDVFTYDVWGNARDGWDVNDRYRQGSVSIECQGETMNKGLADHEFIVFAPTDRQLAIATGWRRCDWEWNDNGYTADLKANGRPVGELIEQVS